MAHTTQRFLEVAAVLRRTIVEAARTEYFVDSSGKREKQATK